MIRSLAPIIVKNSNDAAERAGDHHDRIALLEHEPGGDRSIGGHHDLKALNGFIRNGNGTLGVAHQFDRTGGLDDLEMMPGARDRS
jgi:hypothetical protein